MEDTEELFKTTQVALVIVEMVQVEVQGEGQLKLLELEVLTRVVKEMSVEIHQTEIQVEEVVGQDLLGQVQLFPVLVLVEMDFNFLYQELPHTIQAEVVAVLILL